MTCIDIDAAVATVAWAASVTMFGIVVFSGVMVAIIALVMRYEWRHKDGDE